MEHYQSLESALKRYVEDIPRGFWVKPDSSSDLGLSIVSAPTLPPQIPLIVGDCLQNLRSSLDYLVWELCLAAKGVPSKDNMFPICMNDHSFRNAIGRGRLQGLTEDAIAEIERLQPYAGGEDYRSSNLWILDELTNINKHRRILLTQMEVGTIIDDGITARKTNEKVCVAPTGEMEMEGELAAYIAFQEGVAAGSEVCSILNQIAQFIGEDVVSIFEKFF